MYLDNVYRKKKKKLSREEIAGFMLAFIPVLGYCIFSLVPMVMAVFMAFMEIDGYTLVGAEFIGFDNFNTVLHDPKFWKSIVTTLYMSLSTFVNIALSLLIAFLLTKKSVRGKKVFRTIYFIPYVCSVAATTLMWQWMFNSQYGIVNRLFYGNNVDAYIDWFGDPEYFVPALLIMGVWSGTGYGIILYGAALTNVNGSLYEAAKVDGANSFKSFVHVTLPAISPTTFFLLITGLIGALQEFARPQIIDASGGPNGAGLTVVFYLYQQGFQYYHMGIASATAWLLAIMILVLTVINFAVSRLWVSYD